MPPSKAQASKKLTRIVAPKSGRAAPKPTAKKAPAKKTPKLAAKPSKPVSKAAAKPAKKPLKLVSIAKAVAAKVKAKRPQPAKAPPARSYDPQTVKTVAKVAAKWAENDLGKVIAKTPLRRAEWVTDSGIPIPDLITPADRKDERFDEIALPGEFPFTRGVQPTMYRGRLWTMRQFAGFGTAERHERALQVPARPRADRALDRLRHARR